MQSFWTLASDELISNHCVQEGQRLKQQVLSLRRENSTLDTEVHDKERLVNQLQMKVAVLEQEVKDKEQLMRRTKEVLEAAQQQKVRDAYLLQTWRRVKSCTPSEVSSDGVQL